MDDYSFRPASSDFKRSWTDMCNSLKCVKNDLTLGDMINIRSDDFQHGMEYAMSTSLSGKYSRRYICPLPADRSLLDKYACAYCKKYPIVVVESQLSARFHLSAVCHLMDRYELELADVAGMEIDKKGNIVFRVASYDMPCDRRSALFPKKEDAVKVPHMECKIETVELKFRILVKLPRQTLETICTTFVNESFRGTAERLPENVLAEIIIARVNEFMQEQTELGKLPRQTLETMCSAFVGESFCETAKRLPEDVLKQIIMARVKELMQEQED